MAPKRVRTRNPPIPTIDDIRQEVEERPFLQELPFLPDDTNLFYNQIVNAGLVGLVQPRNEGNSEFVKDCYITAKASNTFTGFSLRDTWSINITPDKIQRMYHLPVVESCQFQIRKNDDEHFPAEEIIHTLGTGRTRWVTKIQGGKKYLKRDQLNPTAKAWLYFIGHNIMPTSHLSEIPAHTALLIYLFMIGEPVGVPDIMFQALYASAIQNRVKQSMIFPHLITDIYRNSRVPELPDDVKIPPLHPLTYARLGGNVGRGGSDEEEMDIPAEGPSTSIPPRTRRHSRARTTSTPPTQIPPDNAQSINALTDMLARVLRNQEEQRTEMRHGLRALYANQAAMCRHLEIDIDLTPLEFGDSPTDGAGTSGAADYIPEDVQDEEAD